MIKIHKIGFDILSLSLVILIEQVRVFPRLFKLYNKGFLDGLNIFFVFLKYNKAIRSAKVVLAFL